MFSDDFRQRLALGKYTKWAVNLTEPDLEALLWAVGEYGYRAPFILRFLDRHADDFSSWGSAVFTRVRVALETIFRMVGGERLDVEELCRKIRDHVKQATSTPGEPTDRTAPP